MESELNIQHVLSYLEEIKKSILGVSDYDLM